MVLPPKVSGVGEVNYRGASLQIHDPGKLTKKGFGDSRGSRLESAGRGQALSSQALLRPPQ